MRRTGATLVCACAVSSMHKQGCRCIRHARGAQAAARDPAAIAAHVVVAAAADDALAAVGRSGGGSGAVAVLVLEAPVGKAQTKLQSKAVQPLTHGWDSSLTIAPCST